MLATDIPFDVYFDTNGHPLDRGKLYFGQPGQNPETNPITVYWDDAGTQPAAQPVTTLNGWPSRAGSPGVIYAPGDYSLSVRDKRGRLVFYAASSASFNNDQKLQDQLDQFAGTTNPLYGAGKVAYNPSQNYALGSVGYELNKRKSVVGTGVAAADVAALQAAINGLADWDTLELIGDFTTNAAITLKPTIRLVGRRCRITHTNAATNLFEYKPVSPAGFPGYIEIENMAITGPGNTGSCTLFYFDANAPYIKLRRIFAGQAYGFAYFRDCYNAVVEQCGGYTFTHGVRLLRECHNFTGVASLMDACTIAGFSVNYGGGAGTGTTHNVNLQSFGLQNGATGLWAENCLELHTFGLYHEGNTVRDYQLGVADGGAYNRACYNVVIDGFNSSSPCGSDRNIRIEHAVGVQIRAAAWNTGCSTTATLASYDGFSDRVDIDILRFTTTTPTATSPVDTSADPSRGVVRYRGRPIYGAGIDDAIGGGTLASKLWNIGHQNLGGRNTLLIKSALDIALQVGAGGVFKIKDAAGVDQFSIAIPVATTAPGAGSNQLWRDAADANRAKIQP